jgi:hypothetical protein
VEVQLNQSHAAGMRSLWIKMSLVRMSWRVFFPLGKNHDKIMSLIKIEKLVEKKV